MKKVLLSDLDGTLLDLKSYSFAKSIDAVNNLKRNDIPVVFCSSKSREEQEYYGEALGLKDPFIVENGSAIFIPKGYFSKKIPFNTYQIDDYEVISLGKSVSYIREVIHEARTYLGLSFVCYFDLCAEEVSMHTGLDLKASRRAMKREFSETILRGRVNKGFLDFLEYKGLRSIPGSKFQTIISLNADKGNAVDVLLSLYENEWGDVKSYGVGDSVNDFEMLQTVDDPYLVQRPGEFWADLQDVAIKNVQGVGPVGWKKVSQIMLEA